MTQRGEGVRAHDTILNMNFELSLSLCTNWTLHVVRAAEEHHPKNKYRILSNITYDLI